LPKKNHQHRGLTVRIAGVAQVFHRVDGFSDVATSGGASFERRWSIAPLPRYSATAVVIVLRVVPRAALNAGGLEVATIADAGAP